MYALAIVPVYYSDLVQINHKDQGNFRDSAAMLDLDLIGLGKRFYL
jgi:hypothetical protein